MDEILTQQGYMVSSDLDRVKLIIGRLEIPMPYASAFKIAQGFRLAAKESMRMCGEDRSDWRDRSRLDYYPTSPLSSEKRTTLPLKFDWSVSFDGEMVVFKAGNNQMKFHFTVALKLAEWLRSAGRSAKRWAGDGGRDMIAAGWLGDAELNYKRG